MLHRAAVLVCQLIVLSSSVVGAEPATVATGPVLPVWAYLGVPYQHATAERFREFAEAGFTHSYSGAPNEEVMQQMLDAGHQHGVKHFIALPALASAPEATAKRFQNHPGMGGYFIRDEPGAGAFPAIAELVKRIQSVDAVHPCYINLLPTYGNPGMWETPDYATYVERFVAEVPTQILSFDHYPIIRTGDDPATDQVRADFYYNLEVCSAAAREANRPLAAFALLVAHNPYPVPTLPHLRLQGYSNLAYGAQVMEYFTYWTVESTVWNFHQAPIGLDGARTPTYDLVKQFNAELQAVRGVFVGSRVESLGHTGAAIPVGVQPYAPTAPIASIKTEGTGAVVSHLVKGKQRFLVVVNRDIHQPMPTAIELDGSQRLSRVARDGTLEPLEGGAHAATIEPGDAMILAWQVD